MTRKRDPFVENEAEQYIVDYTMYLYCYKQSIPSLQHTLSLPTSVLLPSLYQHRTSPQSHKHKMNAIYNKLKRSFFPDASPPRPLSRVWDLRATNYFTTALSGTGMTPLTASQQSTQSTAAGADVLRAQSAAVQAQNMSLKYDRKVWRKEYLRSKKGNVLRKSRKYSKDQSPETKKRVNKLRKSRGKRIASTF